ncbi:MAG TPA: hypothetical protein VF339_10565 [Gammaproteobacteria bacterium]
MTQSVLDANPRAAAGPGARAFDLTARGAFALHGAFVAALLVLSQLPLLDDRPVVQDSIVAAALLLLAGSVLLFGVARRGRTVTLELAPRRQHYLQACQQGVVLLVWGYYWREVYHAAPLIVAQILFAYGVDSLLSWARRGRFSLGFAPVPVIFSISLFLWFRDDWFYWQFVMVAFALAAKEFVRWERDGVRTHIFNPSAFALAVTALALVLTGASDMTWGSLVAESQFFPPYMYAVIFLASLPGQYLFGVTTMTMSAVVTTFAFSAVYHAVTGGFYFVDSHVPIAVFLGMHLLITDPSTSPRTELGRILYGVLYGLLVVVLYDLLLSANTPGFYDKLLPVPLLNLSVILLDRLARSPALKAIDPSALGRAWALRRRHLAYIAVWIVAFGGMSASGYLGDRHPGQWTPFWEEACGADVRDACLNLYFLHETNCADGSAWACNEVGILLAERYDNRVVAADAFERACTLGFNPACANARVVASGGELRRAPPTATDYRYILRGSKGPFGAPLDETDPAKLYARACDLGWPEGCAAAGIGRSTSPDVGG